MTEFNKSVLDFDIRVSRSLAVLNILLHVSALWGITISALPWYGQSACMVAVISSLIFTMYRFILLKSANAVIGVRYRQPVWQLQLRSGNKIPVTLTGEVVVTNFLIVMNYADRKGRRYPVPLFTDSVDAEQHRLGRVFFRMRGFKADSSS